MMCPQASSCSQQELQREIRQLEQIANPNENQAWSLRFYRAMYYARFGGRRPQ